MKKISIICCFLMLFCFGCTGKHNDIIIEDIPVHYGTVQRITMEQNTVIFHFANGYNYRVNNFRFIQPGSRVAVYQTGNGNYAAIVE